MISGIAKTAVGEKIEYITSLGDTKVKCFITYLPPNHPITVAPLGKTNVFESVVKVRFFSAK